MKLIEGRYYQNADGEIRGPAFIWDGSVEHTFQLPGGNEAFPNDPYTLYRPDGTSEYGSSLVKQVPAPGFTLEVGATYETVDGETVGPLKCNADGNIHWPFADGDLFVNRMYYKPDGYSCPGFASQHKDGQDLVHKISPAPLKIEEGNEGLELKITLDTKEAQKLIDDAAKVFDEAAGNLLEKIAEKDEELRAAKKAFNILHREKEGLKNQVETQGLSLNRKNKELNHYRAELSDAEDTIAVKTERVQRAFRLVESANARNANVHKKNEALGFEVLRLNERIHEIRYVANKFVADKKRGDIRLRDTRKRLKMATERAKDAEDQLKGFTSGKAMVRNGLIVLGVVLTAFAMGGFFF